MIDVIEDILTDVNNHQISIGCINNPTDEDYYDDFQYEYYKPDWLGGTETEEFWEHTD